MFLVWECFSVRVPPLLFTRTTPIHPRLSTLTSATEYTAMRMTIPGVTLLSLAVVEDGKPHPLLGFCFLGICHAAEDKKYQRVGYNRAFGFVFVFFQLGVGYKCVHTSVFENLDRI